MDEQDQATRALDAAVGPFYDSAGLQVWLEFTADAVLDLVREGRLLAVSTGDGDLLFPTFQFGPDRAFLPRLDEVLKVMRDSDLDGWSIALWLVHHDPQDCPSAVDLLRTGDADTVLLEAARWVENWKH